MTQPPYELLCEAVAAERRTTTSEPQPETDKRSLDDMIVDEASLRYVQRLKRENDILRGIAAKVLPCHYCGAKTMGECPRGFPGCALADDETVCEEAVGTALREAQDEIAATRKALSDFDHTGGNEPLSETALVAADAYKQLQQTATALRASAELRHRADDRAIKMWSVAHPDRPLEMPDHADLCVWLLEKFEERT